MYLSGEPVDTSLRGNHLLGHLKNIIEAGNDWKMGQVFLLVGSIEIDLLTHCLQETGRKHLQAMQRTKSDADCLWLTREFDGMESMTVLIAAPFWVPFLAFEVENATPSCLYISHDYMFSDSAFCIFAIETTGLPNRTALLSG